MKKKRAVISAVLLVSAAVCIAVGAVLGQYDLTLAKAIRICLECIGIG